MESSEEQLWIDLVVRSLKEIENLEDGQIQQGIEIAQSIRSQLSNISLSPATIALMMLQLNDIATEKQDFDMAYH
tara:strand:- start:3613 stop:3837 length:225 start_codon:yes stop_codon:yes gene_type:complete